jgi:hypothetical protein
VLPDIHPQRRDTIRAGKRESGILDLKNFVFKREMSRRIKIRFRGFLVGLE